MTRPTIVVFGATGGQGGGLVRAILADPARRFGVRAVTRRPDSDAARSLAQAGAEVVHADLDAAASVVRAMEGAHGAFCTTSCRELRSPEGVLAQARTLAWAAARTGVAHAVWSTAEDTRDFVRPGSTMPVLGGRYGVPSLDAKGEANQAFFEHRVPTTLLYPSLPWEDVLRLGLRRLSDGAVALVLPFGTAKLPGIAVADIGACALGVFAAGEDAIGKSIGIAGEHLTGCQMAEQLSLRLGTPVEHAPLSRAACARLDVAGAAELANLFQFQHDFAHFLCGARSVACARELHAGVASFAAWLARCGDALPALRRKAVA